MTRHFGPSETPSETNDLKRNSTGKPNNSATNWCRLNKSLPRNELNQRARDGSSSKAACRRKQKRRPVAGPPLGKHTHHSDLQQPADLQQPEVHFNLGF